MKTGFGLLFPSRPQVPHIFFFSILKLIGITFNISNSSDVQAKASCNICHQKLTKFKIFLVSDHDFQKCQHFQILTKKISGRTFANVSRKYVFSTLKCQSSLKIELKNAFLFKKAVLPKIVPSFKVPYLGNNKIFFKKILAIVFFHPFVQNNQNLAKSEDITSPTFSFCQVFSENGS